MPVIALVGSGPTTVYCFRELVQCQAPLTIMIFEAGPIAGVGTPYDPRFNPVEMLANIASIELPPVVDTLLAYLERCSDTKLAEWNLKRSDITERGFFPRVVIGEYFAAQLELLVQQAHDNGHHVVVHTSTKVLDVIPREDAVSIVAEREGRIWSENCDKIVLATGHRHVADRRPSPSLLGERTEDASDFAILGSSLSAIDTAVEIAGRRGKFESARYISKAGSQQFRITMMSRGGRLPETDFYCPLPAVEPTGFTSTDVAHVVELTEPGRVLDAVFSLFADALRQGDPDYAEEIGLASLTVDSFSRAYFAQRDACDPFVWAQSNLDEVSRNHEARHVVPWRYTILRCHEAFAVCVPALDEDELHRFTTGMKKVFVDNYGAVPPLSMERLLALHASGVLGLVKLAPDYRLEQDAERGGRITSGDAVIHFDAIYDARGEPAAEDEDFPFPTLRTLLIANLELSDSDDGRALQVDATFRISDGVNRFRNVWCCSLPFLLDRHPFIQGLTSCADMGAVAAQSILADTEGTADDETLKIGALIQIIRDTRMINMADGLIVLTSNSGEPHL